jgi:hypothetical protein
MCSAHHCNMPLSSTHEHVLLTNQALMLHLLSQPCVCCAVLPAGNVLLRSSAEDRRGFVAKVADFGLSTHTGPVGNGADDYGDEGRLVGAAEQPVY